MDKEIIGVSGGPGSFSEMAGDYYCRNQNIGDYEIKDLISVENVLAALDGGEIDLGIFPIENSNGGIVYEAVYAMSRHLFNIIKIFEIDVRQNLIARPGIKPEEIRMVASHDQGLKQCKMYLKRKWPEAELKEWQDTADAVRAVSAGELPDYCAAIASAKAAALYGMEILDEGIQDLKFNFTTFLAVTKK